MATIKIFLLTVIIFTLNCNVNTERGECLERLEMRSDVSFSDCVTYTLAVNELSNPNSSNQELNRQYLGYWGGLCIEYLRRKAECNGKSASKPTIFGSEIF